MRLNLQQLLTVAEGIYEQLVVSQDRLQPFILEHIGLHKPDNNQNKVDRWTKEAKPKIGPAPGSAKRI